MSSLLYFELNMGCYDLQIIAFCFYLHITQLSNFFGNRVVLFLLVLVHVVVMHFKCNFCYIRQPPQLGCPPAWCLMLPGTGSRPHDPGSDKQLADGWGIT